MNDLGSGALTGIRVVDLTTVLMGPLASRMLGDHGADVIQVVAPSHDGQVRGNSTGMDGIALDIHRNKRSVALDLKSDEGSKAMWALLESADVIVTNMRAAALDRLGFSADAVRSKLPNLIYCLANGYGQDGPYASRAAYDDAIQALSGFAGLFARIDDQPKYAPSVVVDKICSYAIVQSVMAALLYRNRTGEGQSITVPMFETMAAFNLIEHFRGAALVPPEGDMGYSRVLNPNRRPFKCKDGWIAILPYTQPNWVAFFELIGEPDLINDPRFIDHKARIQNAEALYGIVSDAAPQRTTAEWLAICDELSIPSNPVKDISELPSDPHMQAVEMFQEAEHPNEGKYLHVREPTTYNSISTELRHHAPQPGEHTAEVMRELGWSDVEIESL